MGRSFRPGSSRRAPPAAPNRDSHESVCVISKQTENVSNDDVPRGLDVRSSRAADRFAGLPLAQAARRFASARHANQYRETDHAPFIAHPIEVGQLLDRDGQPDEVIAAGLLHDLLEKTATTSAELQSRFGTRIARLVGSVSDDPSIDDYASRKRDLRERVARGDSNTCAIFAADKISKVRELAQLPPRRLRETKARTELAHYRASLTMLRGVAGDLALVALLDAELNRLVARAVTETCGDRATTKIRRATRSKPRARTT
jgi:HD domain